MKSNNFGFDVLLAIIACFNNITHVSAGPLQPRDTTCLKTQVAMLLVSLSIEKLHEASVHLDIVPRDDLFLTSNVQSQWRRCSRNRRCCKKPYAAFPNLQALESGAAHPEISKHYPMPLSPTLSSSSTAVTSEVE